MSGADRMSRRTGPAAAAALAAAVLAAAVPVTAVPGAAVAAAEAQEAYFPGPGDDWERRAPADVGMDAQRLEAAVEFATDPAHEGMGPELTRDIHFFVAGEPMNEIVGPVKDRGPMTGVVLRHGYLVEEWGEPHRVDMTFSVTKSFLTTVAGLAWDRGLIGDVHEPVRRLAPDSLFAGERMSAITWDHLLRQTSEWEGELWDKPHWVDRFDGEIRELGEPGTRWEYNDVRVNLLALALLHVWREPLPRVLRKKVMDRIDASTTWRWHGYRNSWETVDGTKVQSVSGGGHWGGGMWISARDQARFGLLMLRDGVWEGDRLLSEAWLEKAATPTEQNPVYGYMNWFVNTDRQLMSAAPETAHYHAGAGVNRVYVDPEHDLVVVVRWMDGEHFGEFVEKVLDAVRE